MLMRQATIMSQKHQLRKELKVKNYSEVKDTYENEDHVLDFVQFVSICLSLQPPLFPIMTAKHPYGFYWHNHGPL